MMRIDCPSCGRSSRLPDGVALPKKVRCPNCREVFSPVGPASLPNQETTYAVAPQVVITEPPVPYRSPVYSSPAQQVVNVNIPETPKGNPLAIAALVMGILAALVCWIPLLGLVSLPIAAIGVLLGIPAILLATAGHRPGLAASSVGLAFCIGATWVAYRVTHATADALQSVGDARVQPTAVAAKQVVPADAADAAVPDVKAVQPDPAAEWVVAPASARLDDVEVRILSAKIGFVTVKTLFGDGESQSTEPYFMITVEIANRSVNRKLDYSRWSDSSVFLNADRIHLTDNFSNTYRQIAFGSTTMPVGQARSGSIYPGKTLDDLLVFEVPIDTATHVDVELQGSKVGAKGVFKFRIPNELISR